MERDMERDIGPILGDWKYAPGELSVRKIRGGNGSAKLQIRMDLGLMQLEWRGRPRRRAPVRLCVAVGLLLPKSDASGKKRTARAPSASRTRIVSELAQEAMKYYWRRIGFF